MNNSITLQKAAPGFPITPYEPPNCPVVPEPNSAWLVLLGLCAFAAVRRFCRR